MLMSTIGCQFSNTVKKLAEFTSISRTKQNGKPIKLLLKLKTVEKIATNVQKLIILMLFFSYKL